MLVGGEPAVRRRIQGEPGPTRRPCTGGQWAEHHGLAIHGFPEGNPWMWPRETTSRSVMHLIARMLQTPSFLQALLSQTELGIMTFKCK